MWSFKPKPKPKPKPTPTPKELLFSWSETEYSVGVTLFDQEHRHLAMLINNLCGQVAGGMLDRDQCIRTAEQIVKAFSVHFDHEDRVLEDVGYHDRDHHREEHRKIISQLELQFQLVRHAGLGPETLPLFMKELLVHHILSTDRKYSRCMRRHGFR